jgi:hypothetical protein
VSHTFFELFNCLYYFRKTIIQGFQLPTVVFGAFGHLRKETRLQILIELCRRIKTHHRTPSRPKIGRPDVGRCRSLLSMPTPICV